MPAVFADTFFWVALTNPADSFQDQALAFARSTPRIVTTDEVLVEFLTFFADDEWLRAKAALTAKQLLARQGVRVVAQTRESFLAGLELYRARPDKKYSLTDCISMALMRHEAISDALTSDVHFEQEGFRCLFRG